MKVSLIALYACCAVSSAAFAYQNNPQAGHSADFYAMGTHGSQYVRRDEPGIEPPHVKVMDEPGIEPPHVKVMDEPGIEPPHAAMKVASGLSPSPWH